VRELSFYCSTIAGGASSAGAFRGCCGARARGGKHDTGHITQAPRTSQTVCEYLSVCKVSSARWVL